MMVEHDEIIVFREFDSPIDGSLAKSKLDAYGVPCFLTEENMAGLYPIQQVIPFRVRLHIFKKDIQAASDIFMEKNPGPDAGDAGCPKCGSKKIERDFPQSFSIKPLTALAVLFFGIFFPQKKVNRCLECNNEF
jgi:hypothetical protein